MIFAYLVQDYHCPGRHGDIKRFCALPDKYILKARPKAIKMFSRFKLSVKMAIYLVLQYSRESEEERLGTLKTYYSCNTRDTQLQVWETNY